MTHHHHAHMSHGPNLVMRMQHAAFARAQASSLKQLRRSAAAGRQRAILEQREQIEQARRDAIETLHRELQSSALSALDSTPLRYAGQASALFFKRNFTGDDGLERVVFECNTRVPGSQRPAAAFIWTEAGIEPFDFAHDAFSQPTSRGRVYLFLSTMQFANGDAYAACPADFAEREGGPTGYWSFPTVGRFRDATFFIGRGGVGTFLRSDQQSFLVARPHHFDSGSRTWFWAGQSLVVRGTKLEVLVDTPFREGKAGRMPLLAPPAKAGSGLITLACTAVDSWGDPLGVADTVDHPPHGIIRIKGDLHFFARPNQRDQAGKVLFAAPAVAQNGGAPMFAVTFEEDGVEITAEFAPNYRDAAGAPWFFRYPNTVDDLHGQPLILTPLDTL